MPAAFVYVLFGFVNGEGTIAAGPDGNLWISGSGQMAKVTPQGAVTVERRAMEALEGPSTVEPETMPPDASETWPSKTAVVSCASEATQIASNKIRVFIQPLLFEINGGTSVGQ